MINPYSIRLIFGILFISLGVIWFLFEVIGVFTHKYILDRMHFAGSGDTFALFCIILGAIIINGLDFTSLKLALVLVFFWFASPVSSHLVSRLIKATDENVEDHVTIYDEEESKKFIEQ